MKYLSILMAFIYVVLGVLLLTQPGQVLSLPGKYKLPLAITLIVYGLFRTFIVYRKYFRNAENEDNF